MNEVEDFQRREQALNTAMAIAALQNADQNSREEARSVINRLSAPIEMLDEDFDPNKGPDPSEIVNARSSASGTLSMFDVFPPNVTRAVMVR